ncbi:MAG: hypothetical protein NVSMB29_14750 [Candidatus Dormibacteria bacterium]
MRPLLRRALAPWRRLPGRARLLIIALAAFAAAFGATILPFVTQGGEVTAEVAGASVADGRANQELTFHASIDNTSGSTIRHVCLLVRTDHPVDHARVQFQGTDVVPVDARGFACGGSLSAQETVSVQVLLTPREPGSYAFTLAPADGGRLIGPLVHRRTQIA